MLSKKTVTRQIVKDFVMTVRKFQGDLNAMEDKLLLLLSWYPVEEEKYLIKNGQIRNLDQIARARERL